MLRSQGSPSEDSEPESESLCSICNRRVPLEEAKTNERGLAVHEECYVLKLRFKTSGGSVPSAKPSIVTDVFQQKSTTVNGWKNRGRMLIMTTFIRRFWTEDEGQDIAEYAVMLAVILVLVVGTIRLVGSNANNAFSSVASSLQ